MRAVGVRLTVLATAAAVAVGCDDGGEAGTAIRMASPAAAIPDLLSAPFPSDIFLDADGTVSDIPGLEDLFRNSADLIGAHLDAVDGFSLRPAVALPLTGPLAPQSLPQLTNAVEAPLFVVALDPAQRGLGDVVPYLWRYDPEALAIRGAPAPGTVLDGGRAYAAVVTSELLDAAGAPLRPSPELDVLRGQPVPERFSSTAVGLSVLDGDERLAGRVVAVSVFTTQSGTDVLVAARKQLDDPDSVPPATIRFADPALIFSGADELDGLLGSAARHQDGPRAGREIWGSSNPTGIAHEHVGMIATGELTLARFRRPETGDLGPHDGTFDVDGETGVPLLQSMETIPVTAVLPAAPPPDTGYPVVLFGHGLGSSRHAVVTFAEPLAREGIVVFAIDADGHGSRFRSADAKNNTAKLIPEFTGDRNLSDGFGDVTGLKTTFEFMGGMRNLAAARDGVRQSALDVSQLALALRRGNIDLAALGAERDAAVVLDTGRMAYLGESFGGLVGSVLAAIEPEIELFVLDVPGGGIIDLAIVNGPALANFLLPLSFSLFGWTDAPDRFDLEVSLLQTLLDAADPLTFAPHVYRAPLATRDRPPHLVMIEVLGDEVMPNLATDSLASAMGIELLAPSAATPMGLSEIASPASGNLDGRTAVLVQYGPATHGSNWTSLVGERTFVPGFPHEGTNPFPKLDEPLKIANPLYETLEQVTEVVTDFQAGALPVVRSTSVPVM